YQGTLNNAGDHVVLCTPDTPEAPTHVNPGLVPHVVVDEVHYSNTTPWPTGANQTGKSLQRQVATEYADDPINWRVNAATPGRFDVGTNPDADGDGLPDAWEFAYGLDPHSATGSDGANGDPDQDGLTNLQEYLAGTNPTDPNSVLHLT